MSTRARELIARVTGGDGGLARRVRHLVPDVVRRRYALKFAIAMLVLGLSIGATGAAATVAVTDGVQELVLDEQSTLASQEARNLGAWDDRNEVIVRNLANSKVAEEGDVSGDIVTNEVSSFLNARKSALPEDSAAIYYVNYTSREITATSELGLGSTSLSAFDRPWATMESAPGGVVRTDAYRVSAEKDPTGEGGSVLIAYVLKVPGVADRGIVYVASVRRVAGSFQSTADTGITLVVDGQDRVIFDRTNQYLLATYSGERTLEAARAAEGNGSIPSGAVRTDEAADQLARNTSGLDPGEDYVVGFATVPGTDWVTLVHRPVDEVFGFVTTVRRFGLLATVLGVVLVAGVGGIIGRNTTRAIDGLRARTERMEAGDLDVSFESDRIDSIGRLYDGLANMRDALSAQIQTAEEARRDAEAARQEAEATSQHLREKADDYSEVMLACAEGDLTRRTDPESPSEAMTEIGGALNSMLDEFEETVGQLSSFAAAVAAGSDRMNESAREVRGASEQVTDSVQAITDGAARQRDTLQTVSTEMGELSSTTEQIAASADQVADVAERTAEVGEAGRDAAETAIEGLSAIETESEMAVEEIQALEQEVDQIDDLLEFIDRIADELSMLALNANIEASRAGTGSGESTEGFSVVADQVKELANEAQSATEDIEARLERVEAQTESAAAEVQQTSEEVAAHTESIEDAIDALDEIASYAEETNDGVQEISAATRQQASTTEELVAMVDEVAEISQETADEAERVAAAAEEQTASLEEVSDHAGQLSARADRLRTALERFETAADAESGDHSTAREVTE